MKKRLLIAVCGMSCLASVSFAAETAGVLSEDGKILTVNVDENAVAEFDSATLLANVGVVTNVVKTGMGRLDLDDADDLSAYMGAITVKAGTWRVAASNEIEPPLQLARGVRARSADYARCAAGQGHHR